jgi:hypothetical protein
MMYIDDKKANLLNDIDINITVMLIMEFLNRVKTNLTQ